MDRAPFMSHVDPYMSIEDYHSRTTEVSKSGLDLIAQSPAKFHAWTFDPARPARTTKAGQLEGQLAHAAILEPHEFDKRYLIAPDHSRNSNVWKEWLKSVPLGMTPIKPEQYATAMRQAESVRLISDVRDILDSGRPEVSAFWKDPDTSAHCRCRPDWVHPYSESAVLLDVKTYSDASAREFKKQMQRKFYAKQAAFYTDGYAAASGRSVAGFIFVSVETEWPYAANAVMLDDDSFDLGRRQYKENLRVYAECLRTDSWPGYCDGIEIVRFPEWSLRDE